MTRDAAVLREQFGRPGSVSFEVSPLGGVVAVLNSSAGGTAVVALQGAQVLSWVPRPGEPDVLWCSALSRLGTGKPVRGGIPVCWPWFGPHPDASLGLPAHGLVRTAAWAVDSVSVEGGEATVSLGVSLTPDQQAIIGGNPSATLQVRLGNELEIALITTHQGTRSLALSQALHTYYAVGDIGAVSVTGLEGRTYLDQLTGLEASQSGAIGFGQETDRVYWDTRGPLGIRDAILRRTLGVAATGSASTVIWNPWRDKSARLGDMALESFRHMLCAETANIAPRNAIVLEPGEFHRMACRLTCTKN